MPEGRRPHVDSAFPAPTSFILWSGALDPSPLDLQGSLPLNTLFDLRKKEGFRTIAGSKYFHTCLHRLVRANEGSLRAVSTSDNMPYATASGLEAQTRPFGKYLIVWLEDYLCEQRNYRLRHLPHNATVRPSRSSTSPGRRAGLDCSK